MAQKFLNYDEQINKLINEKDLIVKDREYAISMLKQISYFSLIGGYKNIFINPTVKKYKRGVEFEEIVSLYRFDENLRSVFLKYILKFERKLHSVISYQFTSTYGENQNYYLDKNNFSQTANPKEVQKLIKMLYNLANKNSDYMYLNYHRKKYSNIPLWVLMNSLSLGTVSKFYQFSIPTIQSKVSMDFENLNEKQIGQILYVMTKFRNVCAHGERLFSYRTRDTICDLPAHKKLNIPKNGTEYINGKNDLFAIVISLKYVLENEDFLEFKNQIAKEINTLMNSTHSIGKAEILNYMGFPSNWQSLSRIKKLS